MADEAKRCLFRYTVPVYAGGWTHDLTSDPVHVASGIAPGEVDFYAEFTEGAPVRVRTFEVFGTGFSLPAGARYVGTCPRNPADEVWHLYELVSVTP